MTITNPQSFLIPVPQRTGTIYSRWDEVEQGMSMDEVEGVLGPPLEKIQIPLSECLKHMVVSECESWCYQEFNAQKAGNADPKKTRACVTFSLQEGKAEYRTDGY